MESSLSDFGNSFNPDVSIDSELSSFTSTYESSLSDSFSNYSDVFGFGGYGSSPTPISFNFLGKNYVVFNISVMSEYVPIIRNIFSVTAYLFGIFIIFRGV